MNWVCNDCTAHYSVGAPGCPQCGSKDQRDEGTEKPKAEVKKPETKK